MQSDNATRPKGRLNLKTYITTAGAVVCAVLIFLAGVGIGNGTIMFRSANSANKDLPADLDYASVERMYDLLKASYDGKLDSEKLLDGLKSGMAKAAGDPYTQYLTVKEAQQFDDELNGSFSGIGAELGKNADDQLIIVSPIAGFPASKAGLRPQDVIVSVNGTSTSDMAIDEAVSRIRGPKDTKVTLRILRNKAEDLSLTITRADIKIPSVKWSIIDDTIGYIQVSQFGNDTSELMQQAAQELTDKGAERILLDLRGNPGGLLESSIDMASLWLTRDQTVLEERRAGVTVRKYTSNAPGEPIFKDMPTIVLINAGSASASEIVAGALKDNRAATIVGEKSYGKGSVQEISNLPHGGELKITIARWYTPGGQNIDKKGIKPDTEVKMTDEDYKQHKDPQKDAAIAQLSKQ